MNSSGAVGDILVFTFVNLSDNTIYTENRKCISSSSKKKPDNKPEKRTAKLSNKYG